MGLYPFDTAQSRANKAGNHNVKYFTQLLDTAKRDQRGATAIEYGLIAALICVAMIAAVGNVGETIAAIWAFFSSVAIGAMGTTG